MGTEIDLSVKVAGFGCPDEVVAKGICNIKVISCIILHCSCCFLVVHKYTKYGFLFFAGDPTISK